MKLRLLAVFFALIVPVSACNNSNTATKSTQQPTDTPTKSAIASTGTPATTNNNWYTYSSKTGDYTAKFPEKPIEKQQSLKTNANISQTSVEAGQVAYLDKTNQRIYLVNHIEIPIPKGANAKKLNPEQVLEQGQAQMLKTMGATLKTETKINQNGNPGREITMNLPNGAAAITRVFINTKSLKAYRALIAVKDGNLNFPEAKLFLDSLIIK